MQGQGSSSGSCFYLSVPRVLLGPPLLPFVVKSRVLTAVQGWSKSRSQQRTQLLLAHHTRYSVSFSTNAPLYGALWHSGGTGVVFSMRRVENVGLSGEPGAVICGLLPRFPVFSCTTLAACRTVRRFSLHNVPQTESQRYTHNLSKPASRCPRLAKAAWLRPSGCPQGVVISFDSIAPPQWLQCHGESCRWQCSARKARVPQWRESVRCQFSTWRFTFPCQRAAG
jgi:hypothetical protein